MKKTFKIGEYAIGGIIEVSTKQNQLTITAKDWNTKQVVESKTFNLFDSRLVEEYLCNEVTSYYYAEKIINHIYKKEIKPLL